MSESSDDSQAANSCVDLRRLTQIDCLGHSRSLLRQAPASTIKSRETFPHSIAHPAIESCICVGWRHSSREKKVVLQSAEFVRVFPVPQSGSPLLPLLAGNIRPYLRRSGGTVLLRRRWLGGLGSLLSGSEIGRAHV